MRLDEVTAEIRPRSELEAVDLGLAMVRRDFWRCWAVWWMALGGPLVVLGWWLWESPVWFLVVAWWFKPVGSRMVLFQLSRRLFGEQPDWKSLWREVPRAWTRRFWYRLVGARLSPFLPVTMAVEDLEGLRGTAYRTRSGQVLRRGTGLLTVVYLLADLAAAWFGLTLFALAVMLVPQGQDATWTHALEELDPSDPASAPVLLLRVLGACVLLAMSLTDTWLTGAGFGLYVNTRTWIEGWDVELGFRRMAQRLAKGAGLLALLAVLCGPSPLAGQEADGDGDGDGDAVADSGWRPPEEVIREVKAQPDFEVKKVKRKVRKYTGESQLSSGAFALSGVASMILTIASVAAVVGLVGWMLWKYRHVFARSDLAGDEAAPKPKARVVMGMAVTPESLPPDLPGAVWQLWQRGARQEAMGLLYRGTIARVIEHGRVEIHEADTEGDCLRRVEAAGEAAFPPYFQVLTKVWIRLAYAGLVPADEVVAGLCRDWPFAERRTA